MESRPLCPIIGEDCAISGFAHTGAHKEDVQMATKSSGRKYGKAAGKSVASAVRREKRGTLKSGEGGKGGTVKSRKQAIAIGLSEARKKGAKVPEKSSS
jgi:hypothetical protein